MAFVSQTERRGELSGTKTPNNRAHELEWNVLVDDPNDMADTVQLFPQVVKIGATYSRGNAFDLGSRCYDVEVQADGSNDLRFIVRAKYDNRRIEEAEDPLQRAAVWSSYTRQIELILPFDAQGLPYVNAANDPFDEPIPTLVTILGFSIRKNFATYDPWTLAAWNNAVNTDTWAGGVQPGFAQIATVTPSEPKSEGEVSFFELVTKVEINPYGWQPVQIMNKGPQYLTVANDFATKKKPADSEGVATNDTVFLAADGTLLADGAAKTVIERNPFPGRAFAGLPI